MADRWRPIPTSWARDPRFLGLKLRALRLLIMLHLIVDGEVIEAHDARGVAARAGIGMRLDRVREALEELEAAGFIERIDRGVRLVDHVMTRRARAGRDRGRTRASAGTKVTGRVQRSREDTQPPLARAHSEINPKGFIEREVRPPDGGHPPVSDEQKADRDRRVAAINRMLGYTRKKEG